MPPVTRVNCNRRGWRWWRGFLSISVLLCSSLWTIVESQLTDPDFKEPINNVTIPVGREAMLTCSVEELGSYKVAWLRVDTQTILTIASHVITKNHRIGVTHSEHRTWFLHIKEVKESDRGWYMCQINTDPMKSQNGYLHVVVSPDILDDGTSTDLIVREGSNVTLSCAATGSPAPIINWRREDGNPIFFNPKLQSEPRGKNLYLGKVGRQQMGSYLCLASNGVPPSVSKRISLIIQFGPTIITPNQLIGAVEGQQVTLECISEAYPKSINYWMFSENRIVPYKDSKYVAVNLDSNVPYKVHMKLTIKSLSSSDFGAYRCISRNTLGDTESIIKVYKLPLSSGYFSNKDNDTGNEGSNQGGRKQKGKYDNSTSGSSRFLLHGWPPLTLLLLLLLRMLTA